MSGRSSPPTGAILEKPQKTGAEAPVKLYTLKRYVRLLAACIGSVVTAICINKELR